jgi:hypothetical protein
MFDGHQVAVRRVHSSARKTNFHHEGTKNTKSRDRKENYFTFGQESPCSEFEHPLLNEEITGIGGHYAVIKEVRLPFRGQEILYRVGCAVMDTSCCGRAGCAYVRVAGLVRRWRYKSAPGGQSVSLVELIRDPAVQEELRGIIGRTESVQQVGFD